MTLSTFLLATWITNVIVGIIALYMWHRKLHPKPCDNCRYLVRKGGGELYRYQCVKRGNFDMQPSICNCRRPKEEDCETDRDL